MCTHVDMISYYFNGSSILTCMYSFLGKNTHVEPSQKLGEMGVGVDVKSEKDIISC